MECNERKMKKKKNICCCSSYTVIAMPYVYIWWVLTGRTFIKTKHHFHDVLTHCGEVTPYGDIGLGQHWLRYWLAAWQHQAITCTNINFSLVWFCCIDLRAISQWVPKLPFCIMHLKNMLLKLLPHLPEARLKVLLQWNSTSVYTSWTYSTYHLELALGTFIRHFISACLVCHTSSEKISLNLYSKIHGSR